MKRNNTWYQRLCWRLTRHRLTKMYYGTNRNNRVWCRCRICGASLWQEIKL